MRFHPARIDIKQGFYRCRVQLSIGRQLIKGIGRIHKQGCRCDHDRQIKYRIDRQIQHTGRFGMAATRCGVGNRRHGAAPIQRRHEQIVTVGLDRDDTNTIDTGADTGSN